jgi:hypothetical protein
MPNSSTIAGISNLATSRAHQGSHHADADPGNDTDRDHGTGRQPQWSHHGQVVSHQRNGDEHEQHRQHPVQRR